MAPDNVWDYPCPPAAEASGHHVLVRHGALVLAESRRAWKVMQTGLDPHYFVPPDDVELSALRRNGRATNCPWKGRLVHYDLADGPTNAAWALEPLPAYDGLRHHLAFHAARLDCLLDGTPAVGDMAWTLAGPPQDRVRSAR